MTGFFVDLFIRKVESNQYTKSCVQEDLLNDSQQLGVFISKNKLCKDFPPDKFHYISLRKALFLPIFQSGLQFCIMNVERLKVGA